MKIVKIDEEPIEFFPYLNVKSGSSHLPKEERIIERKFPIYKGYFEADNIDVKALIVSGDLQGNVEENGEILLMGEVIPEFIDILIQLEFPNFDSSECGVLLSGDLYANLEARGGLGDVREVWYEFREYFKWVTGVAGNHDAFGDKREEYNFRNEWNIKLLIRNSHEVDGLRIAGISGIIGKKGKHFRVPEKEFGQYMTRLLQRKPHIFLTHDAPAYPGVLGRPFIRECLESGPATLNICGHAHWKNQHLVELDNGTQVLNTDGKVFILERV